MPTRTQQKWKTSLFLFCITKIRTIKDRDYLKQTQIILYVIQHKTAFLLVSLLQISDERGLNQARSET